MITPRDQDQMNDLEYVFDLSPTWGQGHIFAVNSRREPFELLESGARSEKINELMSWSKILSQISHPSVPSIAWSVFTDENAKVCFRLSHGTSLYDLIKEARLTRIDALCTFYQIALVFKELHARQLTFGHLNLQNIYLSPEGQAQLRGWVPASSHVSFEIRRINDLKLFQQTFYRCIVGFPPPVPRSKRAQLSPERRAEEQEHQRAWEEWYQEEEARAEQLQLPLRSQLHRSSLFMFDAPPKSAHALVEQLFPFTDHALSNLISLTSEQLAQRQEYQAMFEEREGLIRKLDQVRKHLTDWVATHLNSFEECYEEHQALEQLYHETQRLIELLEDRAQTSFVSVHDERLIRHKLSATPQKGTAVYLPTGGAQLSYGEGAVSERAALDPEQGLSLTNRYQILAQSMSNRALTKDDSLTELLSFLDGPRRDAEPGSRELPTRLFGNQATELFQRADPSQTRDDTFIEGALLEDSERLDAPDSEGGRLSADGYTIDRQLSESLFFNPLAEDEPHLSERVAPAGQRSSARPYRRIIASLYLSLFLFIMWYGFFDHSDQSAANGARRAPSAGRAAPRSSGAPITPQTQEGGAPEPEPVIAGGDELDEQLTDLEGEGSTGGGALAAGADEPSDVSAQPSAPLRPAVPEGMVKVPGGQLTWGISEENVARMHQHCKFSPRHYKTRLKRGSEHVERLCRFYIKRDFKGVTFVKENSAPIKVKPFLIDRFEVSRAEYQLACDQQVVVCPSQPTERSFGRLPITNISYSDALDYCKFVGKRLPSEPEWLYAARGDRATLYPWGNNAIYSDGVYRANYKSLKRSGREKDRFTGPHPARHSLSAGDSPFGVSHMGGNVREWVKSSGYRYPSAVMGPSWQSPVWTANLMNRTAPEDLSWRREDTGFRCAKDLEQP